MAGGACKDHYPRLARKTVQGRWHWAECPLTTPDNSLAVRTVHSCTSTLIFTPLCFHGENENVQFGGSYYHQT